MQQCSTVSTPWQPSDAYSSLGLLSRTQQQKMTAQITKHFAKYLLLLTYIYNSVSVLFETETINLDV